MVDQTSSILIVDDDVRNRRLLELMLRSEGYGTDEAASGEEALQLVSRHKYDLMLLDVMMPGMNGYQVAAKIKSHPDTAHIPIIIITALLDSNARLAGLDAGAEDIVVKPVVRDELLLRVRNLLRLKTYSDFLRNHRRLLEEEVASRTADLRRFRAAMDATADAIMLVSRSTMRLLEVNATACNLFGYSAPELLAIDPILLISGDVSQAEYGLNLKRSYDELIASKARGPLTQLTLKRKDGSTFQGEVHRQALLHGNDWIIVSVIRDVTEREEVQARLHHLAHYDALTGLPNRSLFHTTLEQALVLAADKGWKIAVLFLDLDHFKNVNDTLGHASGDELLREFGTRLSCCLRVRDSVGRLGGDEFAVLLIMPDDLRGVVKVANKIKESLKKPFNLQGREIFITASIGISIFHDDASDHETLIQYADTALYQAKLAGRNKFNFFTPQMNVDAVSRLELEVALHQAIERDEFVLYYQPKVDIASGEVVGAEALLRWDRPGHGLISPANFISVLEETGLIIGVGQWVIQTACRQIAGFLNSPIGPLQISVNVAGRQFVEGELLGDVSTALETYAIPPALLELELTESSLMANTENSIRSMSQIKELGVKLSIDDFGTGFSSLAYLCRFPIDKLKIDIAFIRNVITNRDDATITRTIIKMAHGLGLEVIAEGVETEQQLAFLRRYRCDQVQGYYFSRPVPAVELEKLIMDKMRLKSTGYAAISEPMNNAVVK